MWRRGTNVIAKSARHQLKATGEELTFNLMNRHLVLKKGQGVEIEFKDASGFTPALEVRLDEKGKPIWGRCAGPGQIKYYELGSTETQYRTTEVTQLPTVSLQANWQESLEFEPVAESPEVMNRITLTGKAILQSPKHQAGMLAQKIQFWLADGNDVSGNSRMVNVQNSATGQKMETELSSARLTRAYAEQDVAIVSPFLEGQYRMLDITFLVDPALGQSQTASAGGSSNNEQNLQSQLNSSKHPTRIDADEVILKVAHDGSYRKSQVIHVKTNGRVQADGLFADQKSSEEAKPIHLEGDSVEISNTGPHQQLLTVQGNPERFASIACGPMRIDGLKMTLDRAGNQGHVLGAGSIEFPVQTSLDGKQLEQPQLLTIVWKEKMQLASLSTRFIGGVEATLGNAKIGCEELDVHFDRPLSMQGDFGNQKPKIQRIECRNRVKVEMHQYEESNLVGMSLISVVSYQFNQITGEMSARGPGVIEAWQRQNGKNSLGLPESMMAASSAEKPDKPNGWDYTQIRFAGTMQGNSIKREGTLFDRVNVLHGPVQEPLERFERDHRPPNSVWIRCETLELSFQQRSMAAANTSVSESYSLEVVAKENAEIEGDRFLARADQISYNDENRMFVMRALRNRYATIWHYEAPGATRSQYDVKMIRISPDGNKLELDRAIGASGSR